jgi:phenylacetate-coenzyme A ligase PaaK-like adenylate-forming protein
MTLSPEHIRNEVFNVDSAAFEALALEIFLFQYEQNKLYNQFCKTLNIVPGDVTRLKHIPFLPIQFFKTKPVKNTSFESYTVFESSGTTGSVNSRHFVKDAGIYEESFLTAFTLFYGDIADYSIMGLLPSYQERGNSSLVYMVNELVRRSGSALSGFYLNEDKRLFDAVMQNEKEGKKTLLIGVTYALLDFSEKFPAKLRNTIVMETGGMKGRRKELTRQEVHGLLKQRWGLNAVHSEYGMTELLSQAYSSGDGRFNSPPWMKILLRAEDDPFDVTTSEEMITHFASGAINVIDLANIYSCAFIATDDVSRLYPYGSFEVLGRMDNSDIRGCGLMVL